MRSTRFTATVLEGHKEAAVEVPFDPAERWRMAPVRLRAGRNGHRVQATVNGVVFESSIVPRARRFWLEIDADTRRRAAIDIGDEISIAIKPATA